MGSVENGVIADLLSCRPFADCGLFIWDTFLETVIELGRIGHRKDVDANDAAFQIRKMQSAMDEKIFLCLTEADGSVTSITKRDENGKLLWHRCQPQRWQMFCPSPVDLDKSEYPPETWPLWCNGRQTVYMENEYSREADEMVWKVRVQTHGGE